MQHLLDANQGVEAEEALGRKVAHPRTHCEHLPAGGASAKR